MYLHAQTEVSNTKFVTQRNRPAPHPTDLHVSATAPLLVTPLNEHPRSASSVVLYVVSDAIILSNTSQAGTPRLRQLPTYLQLVCLPELPSLRLSPAQPGLYVYGRPQRFARAAQAARFDA